MVTSYEDALKEAGIDSLELRRNIACKRFVESVLPGNPLYSFIKNCPAPQTHGYDLRAENGTIKIKTRTDRFGSCYSQVCGLNGAIDHIHILNNNRTLLL